MATTIKKPQYNPDEDSRIVTDPFLTRAVLWIGLALGTFLTVVAVMNGFRVPGVQVVPSVILTWVWMAALAIVGAALLRRHHRALARHAARHTKRGAVAAGRGTRKGTGAAAGYLTAKAAARWQARTGKPAPQAGGEEGTFAPVLLTGRSKSGRPLNPATGEPVNSAAVYDPDDLKRRLAAASADPDIEVGTRPLHEYGNPERTPSMTESAGGGPAQRAKRRTAPNGGNFPAAWKQVVSETADFEPENDGHLLEWMASEVNGMSAYAESLTEVYETAVNTLGLDPVAMAALHDTADAGAEAASAMAGARAKFAAHYSEVREFAASGGLLPYDGRWITGDGDA